MKNYKNEKLKDNDSVLIDWCQTVIVDRDSVLVNTLTVKGTLVFTDTKDFTFSAKRIIIEKGAKFLIGSKQAPFKKRLTFNMLGDNSVIECNECHMEIYGLPKS